jgi:solute carrier family 34 (sodium-dependent phosphate cotransporter)
VIYFCLKLKSKNFAKTSLFIGLLYLFILSIQLMGASFKLLGEGFAESLITTTSNPFFGLIIGILTTSLLQSSSTTTSIAVGCVAGGILTLRGAIPIIMGANIGTTITSAIVSIGHVSRKQEFQRAFAAATLHEFFNILAVISLFTLEQFTHILETSAQSLSGAFVNMGGIRFLSPLKAITKPVIDILVSLLKHPIPISILSLTALFFSLFFMVKIMRSLLLGKIEVLLDRFLFRNSFTAFVFAVFTTAVIQSSSITVSLIVPLAGAGLLGIKKIFPYVAGANIGTTITALLAACATLNPVAITVALSHFLFNVFGVVLIYPLKAIPIRMAEFFAEVTSRSKKHMTFFLIGYFALHFLPILFIIL